MKEQNGKVILYFKRVYFIYMIIIQNIFRPIPVHVVPLPSNPFLHWQTKLPSMFVQVACVSQLSLPSAHSSISIVQRSRTNI